MTTAYCLAHQLPTWPTVLPNMGLGLPLGLEAPVMTPNGVTFPCPTWDAKLVPVLVRHSGNV